MMCTSDAHCTRDKLPNVRLSESRETRPVAPGKFSLACPSRDQFLRLLIPDTTYLTTSLVSSAANVLLCARGSSKERVVHVSRSGHQMPHGK
jgi:hypothetical protein